MINHMCQGPKMTFWLLVATYLVQQKPARNKNDRKKMWVAHSTCKKFILVLYKIIFLNKFISSKGTAIGIRGL